MIKREIAPNYSQISKIEFLKPEKQVLQNGVPVYSFFSQSDKVIRMDLLFDAGTWYQPSVLVATFTNALLREGTETMSSAEIAEKLDFYGAYLSCHTEKDRAVVTIYCLHKHYEEVIHLVADIVMTPKFPQSELDLLAAKRKEQFRIDSEKVKVLAQRQFQTALFDAAHPYGQLARLEDFDHVSLSSIKDFHATSYCGANCTVLISGYADDGVMALVDSLFGSQSWTGTKVNINSIELNSLAKGNFHMVDKEGAVQSAIRVGRLMFNKTHTDWIDVRFLNTVLGGYFGSRLMANVREDKGYTYGIHSALMSMKHAGFFAISTEVGAQYVEPTLSEIKKELATLQTQPITEDELGRVKNYFMGDLLRSFDGPFASADSFRSIIDFDLGNDFFDKMTARINSITPERLMELAKQYLDYENMQVVVAGKIGS